MLVAALAVVLGTPAIVTAVTAPAGTVDASALRERVARSDRQAHQGVAVIRGSLPLPVLPKLEDVSALVTGVTTVRSWYDSPERWRFDVLSTVGERDTYRTADGEFVWDYGADQVTQLVGTPPVRVPRAGDLLPPDLARGLLATAAGDAVSGLGARAVAGRRAEGLRLVPADPDTTIGRVDVWVDAASGVPVLVEVTPRGAERPVLVSAFEEFAPDRPGDDVLTPDVGRDSGFSTVEAPDLAGALGALGDDDVPASLAGRSLRQTDGAGVRGVGVYGTGLSSFVALPVPREVGLAAADAGGKAGARDETVPNGRVVSLAVAPLSVVVVRAQRVRRWYLLVGMVDTVVLRAAATELIAQSGRGR
ncbi:hypothetical protein [Actinokineospora sp. NBRC 105648]|uniref:hypothetical protein n=1 Tax=Actinokineospora sp. NBRC 105648 TaxID=3032206 RepID=UPI0024A20FB3|nr:hypothetical protein [Actinokineospora sp. NBRC 105648]GLZ41612.1 hypothetical protein Acsp05_52360 [Actinokineospora sp. NBRC 105648]